MTDRTLLLFEDDRAGAFEPLALTRTVARLRVGVWTHRERWAHYFPDREPALVCRGYLAATEKATDEWVAVNEVPEGDVLFVAAALGRPELDTLEDIRALAPGRAIVRGDRLVAARPAPGSAATLAAALVEQAGDAPFPSRAGSGADLARRLGLSIDEDEATPIPRTCVDLMHRNAQAITVDFQAYVTLMPPPDPSTFPGVWFLEPERVRIGEGVTIDPGSVLDAREGPILLGPGTRVGPGAIVQGPVAVGPDCVIKPAARILEGVSLGPVCKMGGEVDETIVLGFSNKQHDGFLGHSVLGKWVNLGAATDTSDLKNDYGEVKIALGGETVATGSRHVGSLIGDHSKTAIHTRLNTGTVVGVSSNVFGEGFPPKEIPGFTWGGGADWQEYRLDKALRVASIVTGRRGIELGPAGEALLTRVHEATSARRAACLEAFRASGPATSPRKAHF